MEESGEMTMIGAMGKRKSVISNKNQRTRINRKQKNEFLFDSRIVKEEGERVSFWLGTRFFFLSSPSLDSQNTKQKQKKVLSVEP